MRAEEIEVCLKEYEALRQEILVRLRMQHQVILFCVMVTGALISLLPLLKQYDAYSLLLLASLLYFIFGWHYFEQDFLIAHVASYIQNALRPAISGSGGSKAQRDATLGWELYRNKLLFRTRTGNWFYTALTLFRLVPTVGCGILTLGGYVYIAFVQSRKTAPIAAWEPVLLVVDGILAVVMIIIAFAAYVSYDRIVGKASADAKG